MKLPLFAGVITSLGISLHSASADLMKSVDGEIHPVIRYYEGTDETKELTLPLQDGAKISDDNNAEWQLSLTENSVDDQVDTRDYQLTWTLKKGEAPAAAVGIEFSFANWSPKNFVFVPAAVYDGNRFSVKNIPYPPYWYDKTEWRKDMPVTMTNQPTLGLNAGPGKIELTTGSASTPLMAFQSPDKKRAWIVQTTQGSQWGDHGMTIEENRERNHACFSITAPAVRSKRATGAGFAPSGDLPAHWKTGDSASIHFRVYSFEAPALKDMLKRFSEVRKDMGTASRKEELPYSEAWNLLNKLFQDNRWDERINMYCLSKPTEDHRSWNYIWQLGWCGGGQVTLPFLTHGCELSKERAMKNLEVIFTKTQAPSGFFKAYGNGEKFAGFGFGSALKNNETFVRSQGDWLYMAQRQFQALESSGKTVPPHWKSGIQKQADAFVKLWKKEGQWGQFVDVETGELCIGNSTAGAIVPGGLALASQAFKNPLYLKIAQEAARKLYNDFVVKGYTTGGPGEILSTPDSESAFALFESFLTLYEVTSDKEWLTYAAEHLPLCASWIVSHDYQFPKHSALGKAGTRSCGSFWASVANKHSAPGICTWSGDSLLKYYRATQDTRALTLLTDIAHGLPQYISRADRTLGNLPPGGICERVNLSDWEGKNQIGGNLFGSCSWVETAVLLTVTQIPGIYAQPDTGVYAVFDNIHVEKRESPKGKLNLRLTNPTRFPAEVSIFSESSADAQKIKSVFLSKDTPSIYLSPNETKEISL